MATEQEKAGKPLETLLRDKHVTYVKSLFKDVPPFYLPRLLDLNIRLRYFL